MDADVVGSQDLQLIALAGRSQSPFFPSVGRVAFE
jgi:hypothetical protein